MFYKALTVIGFHIYLFNTSLECFCQIFEVFYNDHFVPKFSECLLNAYLQRFPNKEGDDP